MILAMAWVASVTMSRALFWSPAAAALATQWPTCSSSRPIATFCSAPLTAAICCSTAVGLYVASRWGTYPRCVRCLGGTSGGTLLGGGCGRTPQRRAEFEAGSFATQLAFRQSVVPHLRRPHPLWPRSARPAGEAGWSERRHLQRRDAWW